VVTIDWEAEQAQKNGYPHFLLKEIHEQPEAVRNALRGRIDDLGMVVLPELGIDGGRLEDVHEVVLVACGTAWYAAMVAGYAIEHLAKLRCKVEAASEFRYGEALVDKHSLVIAVSQSGAPAPRSSPSPTLSAARCHSRPTGRSTCKPVQRSPSPAQRRS
jgi:glucosamine--fructose-6-phosphate aminotransferase (isomerizing)